MQVQQLGRLFSAPPPPSAPPRARFFLFLFFLFLGSRARRVRNADPCWTDPSQRV